MSWWENRQVDKQTNQFAIDSINAEICADTYDVEVVDKDGNVEIQTRQMDGMRRAELIAKKREIKRTDVSTSDVVKVVANVLVLSVMITWEGYQILSKNGTRFIKIL
jgi:hypothetical protein